jgi:lipopolysaccharide transport system permease protein
MCDRNWIRLQNTAQSEIAAKGILLVGKALEKVYSYVNWHQNRNYPQVFKMKPEVEYVIEPIQRRLINWKELWEYRELFYFFTWRDIKVKYKQTALGIVWVILQPLLTVLIFTLFFGNALNVPSSGMPYPVFVFSGLLLWLLFSTSVNTAGNSLLSNASIIKKIYFPRIIVPTASILVSCVDFAISFMMFIGFLLWYDVPLNFADLVMFWPLAFFQTLIATLGISCWLAALNVKYRDFRYVIPFGLQLAMFLSPVIYPTSLLQTDWVNKILALNPMYGAISLFRIPFIGLPADPTELAISGATSLLFFVMGIYYFKKTEAYFADIA